MHVIEDVGVGRWCVKVGHHRPPMLPPTLSPVLPV